LAAIAEADRGELVNASDLLERLVETAEGV
jgi:hypothetical protein